MTRALLMLVVASITVGCTTGRVVQAPPAAEVSGRWVGTWRSIDVQNVAREGRIDLDLAQDGAHGRGRMTWSDTLITSVPESIRLAGALGVPLVFVVSGSTLVARHEASAKALSMNLAVRGDEILGAIDTPTPVEIRLTRVFNPGGPTTLERLGRLEAEWHRDRERLAGLDSRMSGLASDAEGMKGLADRLSSSSDSSRWEDLERRIREAKNGDPATNGHAPKSLVHALDIRFAFDKWELEPDSTTALSEVVDMLKDNPELNAELEGYADSVGSPRYNVQLSQRRVETVHRYLAKQGVALERIHIVGHGSLPEKDADGRAKNRRVTVKLLLGEE